MTDQSGVVTTIVSPITIGNFREMFPAFGDPQQFTDAQVTMWLQYSHAILDQSLWADMKPMGQALFTAHNLVLEARDERAAQRGGLPGQSGGQILSSKSIGGVSGSYDTASGLEQGAGYYNLTTYGTRFFRMMRLVGMGGRQIGGPDFVFPPGFLGPAWPGVLPPPDHP